MFSHKGTCSLPLGGFAYITTTIIGYLPRYFSYRHLLLFGGVLVIAASAMLPFTSSPDTYWSLSFPAFTIGTVGCITLYSIAK